MCVGGGRANFYKFLAHLDLSSLTTEDKNTIGIGPWRASFGCPLITSPKCNSVSISFQLRFPILFVIPIIRLFGLAVHNALLLYPVLRLLVLKAVLRFESRIRSLANPKRTNHVE